MDIKDTKEELESYWFDYQYILEKSKENDAINNIVKQTCCRLEEINSQNKSASVQQSMAEVVDKQLREEEMFIKVMNKKQSIEDAINKLMQPYKTVLYLKYIRFLTFDQIADRMKYSTKRIYQLHNEALKTFDQIYRGKPEGQKDIG